MDHAAIRIGRAIVLIQKPLLLSRARYSRLAIVPTLAIRIADRLDEDVLQIGLLGSELVHRQEIDEMGEDFSAAGTLAEEDLGSAVDDQDLLNTRDLLDPCQIAVSAQSKGVAAIRPLDLGQLAVEHLRPCEIRQIRSQSLLGLVHHVGREDDRRALVAVLVEAGP